MHIARETAGAARTRSSLRPLISRARFSCKTSGRSCRENVKLHSAVIASAAKQPILPREERMDCFAALAMTLIGRILGISLVARMSAAKSGMTLAPTRISRSLSSGAHSRDPLAHPGYEPRTSGIWKPKMIEPFRPKGLAPYRSWPFPIWIAPLGCAIFYPTG
jgi:hypothetical protein